MEDLSRLCFSCMERKDAMGVCPRCGEQHAVIQETPFLPLGGILAERYYIGEKKRRNSEGFTYIAYDIQEGRRCSVREFFPQELAVREADGYSVNVTAGSANDYADGIADFRELWGTLERLRGLTSLITVYDLFDENGSSYAIYEEPEVYTLRDYLLEQHGGYLPWEEARILFMPVLSTIGTLHTSGIVHKGIDPSAFLMTDDGKLKLSGFSITQAKICYGDLEPDVSDGYAPLEIYTSKSELGAWTDIYSFTAVLYRSLIGATPIASPVRAENDQMMIPAKFAERLPPYVINAIINGMQIFPEDRTRNAEQLRANLSASPSAVANSANIYHLPGDLEPEPPRAAPVFTTSRETVRYSQGTGSRYSQEEALNSARRNYEEYYGDDGEPTPEERMAQRRAMRGSQTLQDVLGPTADELQTEQDEKAKTRKILLIVGAVLAALLILFLVGRGVVNSIRKNNEATTANTSVQAVPNFVGKIYDQVVADPTYKDFFVFQKVEQNNPTVPAGQIMNQSVTMGTQAKKGTSIILYVSAGLQMVSIPDVSNKTYEQAAAELAALGVAPAQATKYNDGTHPVGIVVETTPAVGTSVAVGTAVTVVVWGAVVESTTAAPATTLPVATTLPTVAPTTEPAPATVTVTVYVTVPVPVTEAPTTEEPTEEEPTQNYDESE